MKQLNPARTFFCELLLSGAPALVKTGFEGRRGHCALFADCIEEEGASGLLSHWVVPTLPIMECSLVGLLEFNRCTALKIPLQHPIQTPLPKVLISLRFRCEVKAAQTNTTPSLICLHCFTIASFSAYNSSVSCFTVCRTLALAPSHLFLHSDIVSVWPLPSVCKTLALIPQLKT